MSTNKTQNYGLHAWEPQDDFLRQEFNENFAKLDAQAVRMCFGSYTGDCSSTGTTPQRIELGVRPKVVFSVREKGYGNRSPLYQYGGFAGVECSMLDTIQLDESGFTVSNSDSNNLIMNAINTVYYYAAFL